MPIVGDVLADRYRLESVLGVGGMASVYRATDLRLDRQVAVKILAANLAADARFAERFNREASAMAGFSHPNVAAVYDVEPGDPAIGREPFYVMEYCDEGSLADRLKAGGRLPPDEVIPIAAAVSEGLAELHRRGLIHRDIKPANILFAAGRPKLADFGIAWNQAPADAEPLTLPGATLGTGPYLAPELEAGAPPSAASDVYALGVTIFQALTGQYPQPSTLADAGVDAPPARVLPVSAAAPDLGPGFDAALARALDADPAARPEPVELADQLASGVEIWGVATPNPGAIGAPRAPRSAGSGVDMDAPTRVAPEPPGPAPSRVTVPPEPAPPPAGARPASISAAALPIGQSEPSPAELPAPAPPIEQPAVRLSARPRSASRRPAVPSTVPSRGRLVTVGVLAVLALLVLSRLLGGGAGQPGASPSALAAASPSPSASTLATSGPILAALNGVDAAIEAARGGKDGLTGRDGNELAQLATAVRTAVDRGDLAAAASAAKTLSDRAKALAKDLDKERRDHLLAAIANLRAALPST